MLGKLSIYIINKYALFLINSQNAHHTISVPKVMC